MDASSLDALANASVFGEVGNQGAALVATTTKPPWHCPSCTCIVGIQPPSGKGLKHNLSCTCNVCMSVRRRYETLMMRKKQREEAEASKKIASVSRDDLEGCKSISRSSSIWTSKPNSEDEGQKTLSSSTSKRTCIDRCPCSSRVPHPHLGDEARTISLARSPSCANPLASRANPEVAGDEEDADEEDAGASPPTRPPQVCLLPL